MALKPDDGATLMMTALNPDEGTTLMMTHNSGLSIVILSAVNNVISAIFRVEHHHQG
jgi:hypothetical protein